MTIPLNNIGLTQEIMRLLVFIGFVHAIFLAKKPITQKRRRDAKRDSQDLTVDNQSHPKTIIIELYAANINDPLRRAPYVAKNTTTDKVT